MKILVVGQGGREHALVWKLSQSPRVSKLYCAPGNGGISGLAECVPISAADIDGMVDFACREKIDMTVVAPDDPLAAGMVDKLEAAGIRAFGPRKNAALIESSKVFSKKLMKDFNIPTAGFQTFDRVGEALEFLNNCSFPAVVKADGLALGKGVIIAQNFTQAVDAVEGMMSDKTFGDAGCRIVIEEFLDGPEVSVLAFTDGKTVAPMVSAQDHKRALDGDMGLNTGGMGAFSPSRFYTEEISEYCMEKIFKPTINAMAELGRKFKGVLYFGLMLTKDGPKVLEYNARFGDPETQAVLPRLETDIVDIFDAVIDERLSEIDIKWKNNAAACVVMASGGYPLSYSKGYEISGLDEAEKDASTVVFHAGTSFDKGKYYTAGGRVLGVTAVDSSLEAAIERAYKGVRKISFKDMHYRTDIGRK